MNRKKLTLFVLLAVLALSLLYAYWTTPRVERVAAVGGRAEQVSRPAQPSTDSQGEGLRLDLLKKKKERFPGVRRDIFSLQERRPPPPPPPPPPPAPEVVKAPPPPAPVEPPKAILPVPAGRALARFTFLGFLQKEGERTIFLASGGEIFVVKKGERFGKDEEFFVASLTAEEMRIRRGEDAAEISIRLVEQEPLTPSPGNE